MNSLSAPTPILPSTLEREQSGTDGSSMETEQRLEEAGRETHRPQNNYRLVAFLYGRAHVQPSRSASAPLGKTWKPSSSRLQVS